ncbi:uncharacterized protein ATNIH1004_005681 [Aspergillus tanneri]|uniref:Uncharacterized protein n=1 Tax=Aspergillus tanneri TaxID=1220188 RepID=A0A5M9MJ19_9EURO|nr:uncharacterized protein ATNIH1004_005681 [Aspergillus tanneri]KAA8646998.1 hypothetical protein ATNIH1004_005681 [Aspergillus tanneri]
MCTLSLSTIFFSCVHRKSKSKSTEDIETPPPVPDKEPDLYHPGSAYILGDVSRQTERDRTGARKLVKKSSIRLVERDSDSTLISESYSPGIRNIPTDTDTDTKGEKYDPDPEIHDQNQHENIPIAISTPTSLPEIKSRTIEDIPEEDEKDPQEKDLTVLPRTDLDLHPHHASHSDGDLQEHTQTQITNPSHRTSLIEMVYFTTSQRLKHLSLRVPNLPSESLRIRPSVLSMPEASNSNSDLTDANRKINPNRRMGILLGNGNKYIFC